MAEEPESDRFAFGEIHPIGRGGFGEVTGGARGGGYHALLDNTDHGRGFLTEADRRLLLTGNWDDELSQQAMRNARMRIRNRILSVYFDSRYLRYLSPLDKELLFENARDSGYDLHFREGFKEFIRFTYSGLLNDEFDIDILEMIETGIREAEQEYAVKQGENVEYEVSIEVEAKEKGGIEELITRFENHDELSRRELATLVNNPETGIDLADALYYNARQPKSDRYGYSWEDPDAEKAQEMVEWLRSVFQQYDITGYDDLEVAVDRFSVVDEEFGDQLGQVLRRLPRVAPNFEEQISVDGNLTESDKSLIHDILYNPNNIDVETALEEEVRPRTAGSEWDPTEDEFLHKFIARVHVAREMNDKFATGGQEGTQRWRELLDIAEFDPGEWGEYMHEQRVEAAKAKIREVFDEHDEHFNIEDYQPPSEEEIEKAVEEHDIARELIEEVTSDREPITEIPDREDIADVRTADQFHEKFGKTHDTTEILFLEDYVGEKALSQAFEELSEEWGKTDD